MLLPEDRLETVELTLNKVYGDITRELVVSKTLTEDAVKRLVVVNSANVRRFLRVMHTFGV